ncbi:unnamed protein product [Urochloa humidicola]
MWGALASPRGSGGCRRPGRTGSARAATGAEAHAHTCGSEDGDGAAAGAGSSTRPREGAAARAYPWGKGRRSPARLGGDIRGTGETTGALSAVPVSPFSQQTPSTCAGAIPTPGLHHRYRGCPPDTDLGHWVRSAVARLAGLPPDPPSPVSPGGAAPPGWGRFSALLLRAHRTGGRGRSSGAGSRPCTAARRALQLSSGHGPLRTGRSASPDPGAGQQPWTSTTSREWGTRSVHVRESRSSLIFYLSHSHPFMAGEPAWE